MLRMSGELCRLSWWLTRCVQSMPKDVMGGRLNGVGCMV
jgi:hypothetical protein